MVLQYSKKESTEHLEGVNKEQKKDAFLVPYFLFERMLQRCWAMIATFDWPPTMIAMGRWTARAGWLQRCHAMMRHEAVGRRGQRPARQRSP